MFGAAPAFAKNDSDDVIKKFTGGKTPVEGKVKLDLPEIAENGNTVPMTVSVDSPMTEQSHVTEVLIVANENPRAGVVTFHFSPASGVAEANTRIRLAATQNVDRDRQDERRLGVHGEQAGQGHHRRLRRLSSDAGNNHGRMAVKPRIKLDKKEAKKGDLVEVKALVSHVMETGPAQGRRRQHHSAQDPEQVHLHGRRQAGVRRRFRDRGFGEPVHPVQVQGGGVRPGGADLDRRRRLDDHRRRDDHGQLDI